MPLVHFWSGRNPAAERLIRLLSEIFAGLGDGSRRTAAA